MIIGNREFLDKRTYIMGILNVTPDSFSDGGKHNQIDFAISQTERMIKEGADVIDVGGESTRPGYTKISDYEEIQRITPVIKEIKKRFDIPISVDTYKPEVARSALENGADMINDIWGLKYHTDMANIIQACNASCCLMHNRNNTDYKSFVDDVISDLRASIDIAYSAGISQNKILIDPGVGFAKSYEQNLEITNNLERLHALGMPVLLGASRKSMIGLALELPVEERLEGTLATTVLAVMKGCRFVRVHDIKENKRVITMTERILYGKDTN